MGCLHRGWIPDRPALHRWSRMESTLCYSPASDLCLRPVCTLAHVFEAAVLSTVLISSIRYIVGRMHPPWALYAEFPLRLFLGKPRDASFQHRVLQAALALV